MEKLRTVVKFYDNKKAIYRDLFNDDDQLFFCYQGAEYRYNKESFWIHSDDKDVFKSVTSNGDKPKTIKIVDWKRAKEVPEDFMDFISIEVSDEEIEDRAKKLKGDR